ncbi:1-deoxy-D-xylulose-5-phosphate reductoisomerase [Moraxella nasicaprae]|uniref:1-deoxy-D-xylulose 5-phosphate reductoisomerase n=1 Tax=Moraxella nasicaprae TaxID=2904122 RepID=A0ABY6F4W6_9GAMM|nr:1-deoxy-D-xylulose-5-phosphate reductoisomerase [Moraxella nasicaprae]UXZ05129.1 1-deoxy-D-xylulose-5-phosphate reductoisomerase [Moraxella nasicaprae]
MTSINHITLLGATGSIGASTLDLIRLHLDSYRLFAVSGFSNVQRLLEICQEFNPVFAVIGDAYFDEFYHKMRALNLATQVLKSSEGLDFIASHDKADTVVCAIVGGAGLSSTLLAVKAGKKVLLANKESLVMAGDLVMKTAKETGATILPIDSEHNAIFQCLPQAVQGDNTLINSKNFGIRKLWLTASGGAFLHKSYDEMRTASVAQAVNHPNWSMGQKITVDSNTMMNKGLELIEACHLFGVGVEQVAVAIHPQSVVHSLVEYVDGSFLAQCGTPDMKTPIGYALAYPNRLASGVKPLNLFEMAKLEFIKPDEKKFACLALAKQAMKLGNGACIILNAANEVAVEAFLKGKIKLTDIAVVVEKCLAFDELANELTTSFEKLVDILDLDKRVRKIAQLMIDYL